MKLGLNSFPWTIFLCKQTNYIYFNSDGAWDGRHSLDMMHGLNCSSEIGEEDFDDDEEDDLDDDDEEEISVT